MYDVVIDEDISASHRLTGYQGGCENLHGHNWRVRLEVSAEELDRLGLAVDFTVLKDLLHDIIQAYDHTYLNELPDFAGLNPTSENLARIVYQRCRSRLQALDRRLAIKSVGVWESSRTFVRYYE